MLDQEMQAAQLVMDGDDLGGTDEELCDIEDAVRRQHSHDHDHDHQGNQVTAAASLGRWDAVRDALTDVANANRPPVKLAPVHEAELVMAASDQNTFHSITDLLDSGYTFHQQPLESIVFPALEREEYSFLKDLILKDRGYVFSWQCLLGVLDAFTKQDDLLEDAVKVAGMISAEAVDKSLLRSIYIGLRDRESKAPVLRKNAQNAIRDLFAAGFSG